MNFNSVVCLLLLVVIVFVLSNAKVEGTGGDISNVMITKRVSSSVCNGSVSECGTGDEVELLLMNSPRSRLLSGTQKLPADLTYGALNPSPPKTCNTKCVRVFNAGAVMMRSCPRCKYLPD